MPNIKNGKVSLNLKVDEETYNIWVQAACNQGVMNMSEFIRNSVNKAIQENK